jgi:glycosyltransferase involved in cell wall biosynthesis
MSIPIDAIGFSPRPEDVVTGRIGFSGRLSDRRKNIRLLIDAICICRARGFKITASLAGTGADAALHSYVAQRNLTEYIDFLGFVDNTAMSGFYRALDVFVIPSFQEGLGIVGPEAMACGCPVVSTRCGGAEDYVRDGLNGFLVGFSAEEMAEAICKIVGDRALRESMSVAAVDTVKNEYSQEGMERLFWDAFEQTFGLEGEIN